MQAASSVAAGFRNSFARPRALADPWLAPALLVLLAVLLRFPGIESRGPFDADQGNDMLVLHRFVAEGQIPLIGAKVSVGDFHQGALYQLMLLPAARLFGAEPLVVMLEIAVLGLATVAVVWWLARSMGGPLAGFIAGLLVAVSPSQIADSTTVWSASPLPLFGACAMACAWRAWTSAHARWWVGAFAAAGVVIQLHLVGVVLLVPIAVPYVVQLGRSARSCDRDLRALLLSGALGLLAIVVLFLPLAVHELQTGFAESKSIAAFIAQTGSNADARSNVGATFAIGLLRTLSWPFNGLITDAPVAAALASVVLGALSVLAAVKGDATTRVGARWFALTILWSVGVLAVFVPSIATVVPGLPNDQYHAFLDPAVFVLAGLGIAAIVGAPGAARRNVFARSAVAISAAVFLTAVSIVSWPPAVDPNGGWPAVRLAGERIATVTSDAPLSIVGLPTFKATDATTFSVLYAGGSVVPLPGASFLVVTCDRLFEPVIHAECGGMAEDELSSQLTDGTFTLVERFDSSRRIAVSIYLRAPSVQR